MWAHEPGESPQAYWANFRQHHFDATGTHLSNAEVRSLDPYITRRLATRAALKTLEYSTTRRVECLENYATALETRREFTILLVSPSSARAPLAT